MREELERIQKIEMLLNGALSGQERVDFEQQIAGDAELHADVKAQQTVLSGLERLLLRSSIKKQLFGSNGSGGYSAAGPVLSELL